MKNRNKSDFMGGDKNINIPSLLKTVNKNFLDFKESVDNLQKENDSIQKNKYLEVSKQEIETKLNNVLDGIKNFCNLQIKSVSDKYEKIIQKIKNESEELNFELSKKNYAQNELMLLKETYEKKYNESNKNLDNLKSIIKDKENIINTQKSSFDLYEKKIFDFKIKVGMTISKLKIKENEYDSLFSLFDYIVEKKKDRFEREILNLSPESQSYLRDLVKKNKVFK